MTLKARIRSVILLRNAKEEIGSRKKAVTVVLYKNFASSIVVQVFELPQPEELWGITIVIDGPTDLTH